MHLGHLKQHSTAQDGARPGSAHTLQGRGPQRSGCLHLGHLWPFSDCRAGGPASASPPVARASCAERRSRRGTRGARTDPPVTASPDVDQRGGCEASRTEHLPPRQRALRPAKAFADGSPPPLTPLTPPGSCGAPSHSGWAPRGHMPSSVQMRAPWFPVRHTESNTQAGRGRGLN